MPDFCLRRGFLGLVFNFYEFHLDCFVTVGALLNGEGCDNDFGPLSAKRANYLGVAVLLKEAAGSGDAEFVAFVCHYIFPFETRMC